MSLWMSGWVNESESEWVSLRDKEQMIIKQRPDFKNPLAKVLVTPKVSIYNLVKISLIKSYLLVKK